MPLNYHNNSPHSPMLQIIADLLTRAYIVETFDRSPYCGTIPPRLCHHKITPWIPWVPMLGRSQNHMPLPSIHWTLRRWKRIQKANGPWVHHGSKPTTLQSWWLVVFFVDWLVMIYNGLHCCLNVMSRVWLKLVKVAKLLQCSSFVAMSCNEDDWWKLYRVANMN